MAGLFKFVDVVPEPPAAPVGGGGLFAAALGIAGFLAVAVIEEMAKPSHGDEEDSRLRVVPGASDYYHVNYDEYWG